MICLNKNQHETNRDFTVNCIRDEFIALSSEYFDDRLNALRALVSFASSQDRNVLFSIPKAMSPKSLAALKIAFEDPDLYIRLTTNDFLAQVTRTWARNFRCSSGDLLENPFCVLEAIVKAYASKVIILDERRKITVLEEPRHRSLVTTQP